MAENLIDLADRLYFKSLIAEETQQLINEFLSQDMVYSTEFKRYCDCDLDKETGELITTYVPIYH